MMNSTTDPLPNAQALTAEALTIVIKIGSSLVTSQEANGARTNWLITLGADIARILAGKKRIVIVSSGAVALGRRRLEIRRSSQLHVKQAAAAAGQPILMNAWESALAPHGYQTAQLLLTLDDTESRHRWLNARATLDVLLREGVIPVVNENDSVATEELRYGDNDRLSARVAQMVRADLLILLSDVDGLYTTNPATDPNAVHVPHLRNIGDAEKSADGARANGVGTGGMRSKLAAARIAQTFGCRTIIASGREDYPISNLLSGAARCTIIDAATSPASAYKQWIAGTLKPAGTILIDEGAAEALAKGRSLLPSGVSEVVGPFEAGACVRVLTQDERELARGIVAYSSREVESIRGCASSQIEERLGYRGRDEIIHRNDLVMM